MTLHIQAETNIFPYEVAGITVNELERFLNHSLPDREWYLDELVKKAEKNYVENPHFKKKLKEADQSAKGWLYMIMRGWFVKLVEQHNPSIFKALPPTYSLEMPTV